MCTHVRKSVLISTDASLGMERQPGDGTQSTLRKTKKARTPSWNATRRTREPFDVPVPNAPHLHQAHQALHVKEPRQLQHPALCRAFVVTS